MKIDWEGIVYDAVLVILALDFAGFGGLLARAVQP